jgi:hypothetical protein
MTDEIGMACPECGRERDCEEDCPKRREGYGWGEPTGEMTDNEFFEQEADRQARSLERRK